MHSLGRANWYLPRWLEHRLPRLEIEAGEPEREADEQPLEGELEPAAP